MTFDEVLAASPGADNIATVFGKPDTEMSEAQLRSALRVATHKLCRMMQDNVANSRALAIGQIELWKREECQTMSDTIVL